MGLFTPAWKSKNTDKAVKAVAKITDQKKLERIALEAPDGHARHAAVKEITDQSALADVAKNSESGLVRVAAVEKIRTAEITAVEKITDQSALTEFAKNSEFGSVREAAVKKLFAKLDLADVAKKAKYGYIRQVAVEKITDQYLLADILNNMTTEDYYFNEGLSIIKKITDKNVLSTIHLSSTIEKMIAGLIRTMGNDPDGYTSSIAKDRLKRREAAESLIALATKMPHLIKKNVWNNIAAVMGRAHEDVEHKTGNSSDCKSLHTDTGGINMTFPPYPFND
jgi:hypothetical protein